MSDLGRLTNRFFLKDRCALPDQMSSVFTFSRRRFILAMRDGDGANKNKIAVFDFGVTPKHFPHDMLLNDHRSPRSALGAVPIYRPSRPRCSCQSRQAGHRRRRAYLRPSTRLAQTWRRDRPTATANTASTNPRPPPVPIASEHSPILAAVIARGVRGFPKNPCMSKSTAQPARERRSRGRLYKRRHR